MSLEFFPVEPPQPDPTETSESETVLPTETIRISRKLAVTAVPIEYYPVDTIDRYGPALVEAIKQSDGLIFEYFPAEMKHMSGNKLVRLWTNYNQFMPFQEFLSRSARDAAKPSYVADPAQDLNFAAIRLLPTVLTLPGYVLMGASSLDVDRTGDRLRVRSADSHRMTRRERYLRAACFAAGLVSAVPGILMGNAKQYEFRHHTFTGVPNESTMRRVIVAKALADLGVRLDSDPEASERQLLLMYPPAHWKGIKQYLEHPSRMERDFRFVSVLKRMGDPFRKSFFTLREYVPAVEGGWEQVSGTEI